MAQIIVDLPSQKHIDIFMGWMSHQGEQAYPYWEECRLEEPEYKECKELQFKYDYKKNRIIGRERG